MQGFTGAIEFMKRFEAQVFTDGIEVITTG
jgi:hypothetical protein